MINRLKSMNWILAVGMIGFYCRQSTSMSILDSPEQKIQTPCINFHAGRPRSDETAACLGNVALPVKLLNTDLVLVYNSQGTTVDRFYMSRSRYTASGPRVAVKWGFLSDATLFPPHVGINTQNATLVLGDGTEISFSIDSTSGNYLPDDPRMENSLLSFDGTQWVQTLSNGSQRVFGYQDTRGVFHLTAYKNVAGRVVLSFSRGNLGKILSVSGLYGFKGAAISYETGQVTIGNNTLVLDNKQRLTSINFPAPLQASFEYDDVGPYLTRYTDLMGRVTRVQYNSIGLVSKVTDPLGFETNWNYTSVSVSINTASDTVLQSFSDGKISSISSGEGLIQDLQISRDTAGRATQINQLGLITKFEYALSGRFSFLPTKVTTADGLIMEIKYNDQFWNRPVKEINVSGQRGVVKSTFEYASPFQLTKRTVGNSVYVYQYNSLNQVTSVTLNGQELASFSYDSEGNLTSKSNPIFGTSFGSYNLQGLPGSISQGGDTMSLIYDSLGRPTSMSSSEERRSLTYGTFGNIETDQVTYSSGGTRTTTRTVNFR